MPSPALFEHLAATAPGVLALVASAVAIALALGLVPLGRDRADVCTPASDRPASSQSPTTPQEESDA